MVDSLGLTVLNICNVCVFFLTVRACVHVRVCASACVRLRACVCVGVGGCLQSCRVGWRKLVKVC